MDKKKIYHIVEWTVALAACGYLVWRLATYDDYAGLWAGLRGMDWRQWTALAVCVAMMPVNMAIEAWRWRTLWNGGQNPLMSFSEAQRQVYYSKLAGLITPWRLGEYPARAVIMSSHGHGLDVSDQKSLWTRVLSMGAVGSATMTAAIVIAGMVGLTFSGLAVSGTYRWLMVAVLAGMAVLAVAGWLVGKMTLCLTVVSPSADRRYSIQIICKSLGQSFVRLLCWCVQLFLVLYALGAVSGELSAVSCQPSAFSIIGRLAVYYLFVTVTPNVPIAEAGVRGVWAIAVFGSMNAALAGVLLWGINTLLPCVLWPFVRKNTTKQIKN